MDSEVDIDLYTVTVTFIGVCTHFRGVVPGIPHRVVLPDASAFRFGITMLVPFLDPDRGEESTPNRATYFLMPHFSVLRMEDAVLQQRFNVDGVMQNGNVYSGVRLAIENAKGAGVTYESSFDEHVTRLTSYVESYAYSPEVVLGGLAGVYFDLFSGNFSAFPSSQFNAIDATVTIKTNGRPKLLATPFFGGEPHIIELTLEDHDPNVPVELYVANQGMDCDTQENQYDFLLHYLTSRTGIPRRLIQPTPGMKSLEPFTPEILDAGANTLKNFDFPASFDSECLELPGLLRLRNSFLVGRGFPIETPDGNQIDITTVACSNSQYP